MTNYEKIKAMSVEEMVEELKKQVIDCEFCPATKLCEENIEVACCELMRNWLLQEAEE